MKNQLFLSWAFLALIFIFPKNINGQCGNTDIEVLNANKIKTAIPVGGDLFWDRDTPDGLNFIVPYVPGEPEVSSIFIAGLWLGGYNEAGYLGTSCQMYGNRNGNADYRSGPINDDTGEVLENGCDDFDKVWKVNREDILSLIADFENNGNIDQAISPKILQWPGRGNAHFENEMGFVLPDQNFAPFFDRNNNGTYEPLNGEYPIIDEAWPDIIPNELTWCVFNDLEGEFQNQTGGNRVGVEVHQLAYGFNCENNDVLNHTIFTRHKIINKSGGNISDFMAGFWMDMDIGCYADDFIGCDTLLNTGYNYNCNNEDGHPNCDLPTYGENPPVQAATLLNHSMDYFMYHLAGGICDVWGFLFANDDEDHYHYLTGRFKDGTPLSYGIDGYLEGETTQYAFSGNPSDPEGWSIYDAFIGCGGACSYLSVMSSGPHHLSNDESLTLDMAFSFHRNMDSTHLGNVNVALENIPTIQNFFDNGFENDCSQIATSIDEHILGNIELEISPNPNSGQFSILPKNNFQDMSFALFDISGKDIWQGNIPGGQNSLEVNLSKHLSRGIYLLKAVREDGTLASKKLIVK